MPDDYTHFVIVREAPWKRAIAVVPCRSRNEAVSEVLKSTHAGFSAEILAHRPTLLELDPVRRHPAFDLLIVTALVIALAAWLFS